MAVNEGGFALRVSAMELREFKSQRSKGCGEKEGDYLVERDRDNVIEERERVDIFNKIIYFLLPTKLQ